MFLLPHLPVHSNLIGQNYCKQQSHIFQTPEKHFSVVIPHGTTIIPVKPVTNIVTKKSFFSF